MTRTTAKAARTLGTGAGGHRFGPRSYHHRMGDTFHWLDVHRIGEELFDAHPDLDPMSVRFPELRRMVEALEGFQPRPGHPVNERILEAIQMAWLEEFGGAPRKDDDAD